MADSGSSGGQWNWAALSQSAADTGAQTAGPSTQTVVGQLVAAPSFVNALPEPQPGRQASGKRAKASDGEDVEAFSKLRITRRTVSAEELKSEMSGRRFISLASMDRVPRETFTDEQLDWVTIGVLVRKTLSKPTANGSTFMVWGLADLEGTELGVFLFDEAYDAHWKQAEGAIVALLNATLLPATEKNKFAFKVTCAAEVVVLGTAADFGICKGTSAGDARCRLAVNTARSQYCLHHIATNFSKAGRGRQQLNNSLGNIRKSLFTAPNQPKNISAGVYTSASSRGAQAGRWNPLVASAASRKRPRDNAGVLSVPTVLSSTGTVVQRPPPLHVAAGGFSRSGNAVNGGSSTTRQSCGVSLSRSDGSSSINTSASKPQPPRRVSRGEKIISLLKPGGAQALKRAKSKKVDMIRFMNSGSKS